MHHERKIKRESQQEATNLTFISVVYRNMFRGSLRPSSGEQDCVLPHMVFCTGCASCGRVEMGRKLGALCATCCTVQYSTTNAASTTSTEHHTR